MTGFGKILVLLNLALSLVMAAWALALVTTRIDWSNQKGKDGKPDGELLARQALTKEMADVIPQAELRWRTARATMLGMEDGKGPDFKDSRSATRAWYDAELRVLRTGDVGGKKRAQMLAIVLDDKRQTQPDDANFGRPKLTAATDRAGKPLTNLEFYNKEEENILKVLADEQKRLENFIVLDTKQTELLLGDKGLQQRLVNERLRRADVMAEQGLVKPMLINTYVDSELLLQRRRQLERRLEELKKARAGQIAAGG